MAQVRMRHHISGGRADGTEWPHAGGVLECGDAEAADLVFGKLADWHTGGAQPSAAASAAPVAGDASQERENGSQGDEDPDSPAVRAAKAEWVEHAVAKGCDRAVAESMTKADLIAQFGSP